MGVDYFYLKAFYVDLCLVSVTVEKNIKHGVLGEKTHNFYFFNLYNICVILLSLLMANTRCN